MEEKIFHHLGTKNLFVLQFLRLSIKGCLTSLKTYIVYHVDFFILTHIFEHPTVLGSILAKLKGFICHVRVPPAKSFCYLGDLNDQWM